MLHLLPIRLLLLMIIILTATIVLALTGAEPFFDAIAYVLRWGLPASICVTIIPCIAWRWVPFLQRQIFPYLGGEWEGILDFSGPRGLGRRNIRVDIHHNLYRMRIQLDSEQSTSRTLALYVERDTGIQRHRLYYVYLNERKEGLIDAGGTYRGLAILGVVNTSFEMSGNYFTEYQNKGTLELKRRRTHPWWTPLR